MKNVKLKTEYSVKAYVKGDEDAFLYELTRDNPNFNDKKEEGPRNAKYNVSRFNKNGYQLLLKQRDKGKRKYLAKDFTKIPVVRDKNGFPKPVDKNSIILTELGTFKRIVITKEELGKEYEEVDS